MWMWLYERWLMFRGFKRREFDGSVVIADRQRNARDPTDELSPAFCYWQDVWMRESTARLADRETVLGQVYFRRTDLESSPVLRGRAAAQAFSVAYDLHLAKQDRDIFAR